MSNVVEQDAVLQAIEATMHCSVERAEQFVEELRARGIVLASDPCLVKLREGEPYFVLRGQDQTAAETLRDWMDRVVQGYGGTLEALPKGVLFKISEAELVAKRMEVWHTRKLPD